MRRGAPLPGLTRPPQGVLGPRSGHSGPPRGCPARGPSHAAQRPAPAPHQHSGPGCRAARAREQLPGLGPFPPPPAPVPPRPPRQAPRVSRRALLGVQLPAGLVGVGLCSGPSGGVRPFPASCSGSFRGGRPPSFFQSVVLRAFSPRSPCFRLGKVRETLSSVVTSEPFGLNSKCGRQRPWGARGALHVRTVGAWGTAWAAC